jgi:hypothetical protein
VLPCIVGCSARAAVTAWWIRRGRKPSWRPERTAVVHRARAGHGWHVALANRARMKLVPLLRAGVQELLTAPCGQVTCLLLAVATVGPVGVDTATLGVLAIGVGALHVAMAMAGESQYITMPEI